MFHNLNVKCINLKILEWNSFSDDNIYSDEHFICVMQRIQHLKTDLLILSRIQFNLDNLTELTLFNYHGFNDIINMTFDNVTKLNIIHDLNDESISNFKFPKLEYLNCECNLSNISSFINQFKQIKTFDQECDFDISIISQLIKTQLNQLTNLICNEICLFNDSMLLLYELFVVLSNHKSLQNIKLTIKDFDLEISNEFYDKLISLFNAKSNTKITISILERKIETNQNFNQYKKLFDHIKHLYKLNMQMSFF